MLTERCLTRWVLNADFDIIITIENAVFEFPWSLSDFKNTLKERNCICLVAEVANQVCGYVVYALHKNRIELLNIAVAPEFQRQGIGSTLLEKMKGKLSEAGRRSVYIDVRETNLKAQTWLRKNNFKCVDIKKDVYDESDEDTYVFKYKIE